MKLKFKKLLPDAVLPEKAHMTDAGLDLTAVRESYDYTNEVYVYYFGLAVEIPEGYVGLLFPRSSVYKTGMVMSNCVGVIDSGYRGEIMAKFYAYERHIANPYDAGHRVCQLIVMPLPDVDPVWADELSDSDRGEGGYGSTGL